MMHIIPIKRLRLIGIMCFLFFTIVLASQMVQSKTVAEDYLGEFNNSGETCEIIDAFVYDVAYPKWWDSEHSLTTLPTFYQCCSGESCTTIIFDIKNKVFLQKEYLAELINLNYIKYNLISKNISEGTFISRGTDVCSYFGGKEIAQETANLASESFEKITPVLSSESAYKVKSTINTAKKIGAIERFNPSTLIVSVGCNYDNKILKQAVEDLSTCNFYLTNIKNNYAKSGYTQKLNNQISLTKSQLKIYLDSKTAIVRSGANSLLNTLGGIVNFFVSLFTWSQHPNSAPPTLTIEKTEYRIAQDVYQQISEYHIYLENPNNEAILQKQDNRINYKKVEFQKDYAIFNGELQEVSKMKPSIISVYFIDLFYKPNYNLSQGFEYFERARDSKYVSERLFFESRFNSAEDISSTILSDLNLSRVVFTRENLVERHFDKRWIYFIIFILFCIILLKICLTKRTTQKESTPHQHSPSSNHAHHSPISQ